MSCHGGQIERNHKVHDRWYVVHARPHAEKRANLHLREQGFATFLPLHQKTVRHARKFRTIEAPFFPRYLFVQMDVGRDRWRSIHGTTGVSHLIMEGDLPKPVPLGVVEGMTAAANPAGLMSGVPRLSPGEAVRVVRGPLSGLVGRLVALDEKQRVKVLLDILGKETGVAIEATRVGLVPAVGSETP